MIQTCPLCGNSVHSEYDPDPENLAGKYCFCRRYSGGCRATFRIPKDTGKCISCVWKEDIM